MKNGNRLSETRNASVLPYTYSPAGSNWLYQKGGDIRGKTFNGNTASMSGANFTYDGYNRLATSTTPSETTTYTYNALGERIKKINQNGLATSFHYGNNGELLYERDQAGNTKAYVWLDGRPLARIDNDATIYYYHVDHLGTPQAMTNAAGAVVWKADYEPFGKVTVKVNTIENNLRFPGQYADRETGLHYNYYRSCYDPLVGRYCEFDPIGLEGGLNGYLYANANPLTFIDPLGLTAIPKPLPPLPIPGRPGGGSGATNSGSGSAVPGGRDRPDGRPDRPVDRPDRCDKPDRDNECEQHRKEDEAACTVPIIRYGYARGKACLDSAMIRYGECLRFGVDGIRTPLHGVDTPL